MCFLRRMKNGIRWVRKWGSGRCMTDVLLWKSEGRDYENIFEYYFKMTNCPSETLTERNFSTQHFLGKSINLLDRTKYYGLMGSTTGYVTLRISS